MFQTVDVLVVGAGMAGLMAATRLHAEGRSLVVLDKGRGVGGRMATRRWDEARFDHGAQFFTARDPNFQSFVRDWQAAGVVTTWPMPSSGEDDEPRYRGVPSMTAVCKHLARELDVRKSAKVDRIESNDNCWSVHVEDGRRWQARSLLLTAPMPQCLVLLDAGGVTLPPEIHSALTAIRYDPCFAVMARLDGACGLPESGALHCDDAMLDFIADNQRKGISTDACVTIHTTGAYSREHWDLEKPEIAARVLSAAEPYLRASVRDWQVMKWKFSRPVRCHHESHLLVPGSAPLVFAGDGFGGPRVEGAALSGLAAAGALEAHLNG